MWPRRPWGNAPRSIRAHERPIDVRVRIDIPRKDVFREGVDHFHPRQGAEVGTQGQFPSVVCSTVGFRNQTRFNCRKEFVVGQNPPVPESIWFGQKNGKLWPAIMNLALQKDAGLGPMLSSVRGTLVQNGPRRVQFLRKFRLHVEEILAECEVDSSAPFIIRRSRCLTVQIIDPVKILDVKYDSVDPPQFPRQ